MTRFLMDISRTLSRVGRGHPTGIDRVEIAYIRATFERDPNAVALAAMGREFVLVPLRNVVEVLPELLSARPLRRPSWRDALRLKLPAAQRAARSLLRSASIRKARTPGDLLAGQRYAQYLNVGHTNLTEASLQAVRATGATIRVMVHDIIPLDHPEFTRQRAVAVFRDRMQATARHADQIICNSAVTEGRVRAVFPGWGRCPDTLVAHLGVDPSPLQHAPAEHPSFVVLGTIEPRKNHAILLDAWQTIRTDATLRIIGRRGWRNKAVFDRLDAGPPGVEEIADADDATLHAHLAEARALLFPSYDEGFGLPALEAAQMGLPVVCSDIPVFHEILGGYATFLPPDDAGAWTEAILALACAPAGRHNGAEMATPTPPIPRWDSHFRRVLGENSRAVEGFE